MGGKQRHTWTQGVFPTHHPATREEVYHLGKVLDVMLREVHGLDKDADVSSLAALPIVNMVVHEERGRRKPAAVRCVVLVVGDATKHAS